jgi:pimeloyl-ACP methyl ester carboxylesterase
MNKAAAIAEYFHNGLPYNRIGYGSRNLIVFQGLTFENKPAYGLMAQVLVNPYKFLGKEFTTYVVGRKPNLPIGYTMKNMSDDYATMIKEEFEGPVDVIGVSTGGSIAQHFAADHPELIRKLVIHSSAHTLSDWTKDLQLRTAHYAKIRDWTAAYNTMLSPTLTRSGISKYLLKPIWRIGILLAGKFAAPADPSDLVVTIEAEDKHNFKDRLGHIAAPTLVVAGDSDPLYSPSLFRETAEGIPNGRLVLYKGMGHPAHGKQFQRDVSLFLNGNGA